MTNGNYSSPAGIGKRTTQGHVLQMQGMAEGVSRHERRCCGGEHARRQYGISNRHAPSNSTLHSTCFFRFCDANTRHRPKASSAQVTILICRFRTQFVTTVDVSRRRRLDFCTSAMRERSGPHIGESCSAAVRWCCATKTSIPIDRATSIWRR